MLIAHLNMTDFMFSIVYMFSIVAILNLASSIFEGPKSACHFYQYGPTLPDGLLHIMNFGAPMVHCIRLEMWFFVNSTFKYDKFCVF